MASERQILVGSVPVGGGAPVAVQTMTKTETANLQATMRQIRTVAEAGADIVRVAVPREPDAEALKTIVAESPIPVIADIHFNHTLALKAIEAGAHCVRLNPGNIGGPEKVAEVIEARQAEGHAAARRGQLRLAAEASAPARVRQPRRGARHGGARDRRADGAAGLQELQGLDEVDLGSQHDRLEPRALAENPLPAAPRRDGGRHEVVRLAEVGGRARDAAGGRDRDTIRISLSTFHAEEEVKVAWEILKALKLREKGPVLIACPTCGRLQFDMDTVVAEVEQRLEAYEDPIAPAAPRRRGRRGPPGAQRVHRLVVQLDDRRLDLPLPEDPRQGAADWAVADDDGAVVRLAGVGASGRAPRRASRGVESRRRHRIDQPKEERVERDGHDRRDDQDLRRAVGQHAELGWPSAAEDERELADLSERDRDRTAVFTGRRSARRRPGARRVACRRG